MCWAISRRHLARSSKMEIAGVSSIKIGAWTSFFILVSSCFHSSSLRRPFLILSPGISVSEIINLFTSCIDDISHENIATCFPWSIAIFLAIERANAVLPIEGRAAMITSSAFCQPDVSRSSFVNPDGVPTRASSLLPASSISLIASFITILIGATSLFIFPSAIWKRAFSE